MPVTVKIEDKQRRRSSEKLPPPAQLSDYAVPNERSEGFKAFWIWTVIMLMVCGLPLGHEVTRPFGIGLFTWWFASVLAYYVVAPRMLVRRLRLHGAEYAVTSKTHPRLKTLLSKGSVLVGITEPEAFYEQNAAAKVRIVGRKDPYFMVVTEGAAALLTPQEIDCLALRCLLHGRQGHVGRLMMIQFLHDTPVAVRILFWPIVFYANMLQAMWMELAHQTADRLTLLLLRNHRLLLSAILKLNSVTDPIMIEAEIAAEDVEAYVKQDGVIGIAGAEISTQYKIGTAISANPFLEERLRALNEWVRSPEYQEALEKLAEARAKHASSVSAMS